MRGAPWRADQADFGQGPDEVHGYEAHGAVVGKIEAMGGSLLPMVPIVAGLVLPRASIGPAEIRFDQSRVAQPPAVGRLARLARLPLELGNGMGRRGRTARSEEENAGRDRARGGRESNRLD